MIKHLYELSHSMSNRAQNDYKGQKNPMTDSRKDLQQLFYENRQYFLKSTKEGHYINYTTNTTQSSLKKNPTTKKITELSPITIRDLVIETIHTGKVLIVKTIVPPFKMNAIQLLVEDEEGGDCIASIAVYNTVLKEKSPKLVDEVDSIYPIGIILAIKEPYFKISINGNFSIRVDDPKDIEFIETSDHPLLAGKPIWKRFLQDNQPKHINGWKSKGNDFYASKLYEKALQCYDEGLKLDRKHEVLALNKMAALLQLKRYEECISHGNELLARRLPPNEKLLHRLATSYYELGIYEKASEHNEQTLKITPSNQDAKSLSNRIKDRIKERDQGHYNHQFIKDHFKKTGSTDCSQYFGPIKIIESKMGRGLAVTKDIPVGTLLMVSKGIGGIYEEKDNISGIDLDQSFGDKTAFNHTSIKMVALTSKMAHNNPHIAYQLSKLYFSPSVAPEKAQIDDFRPREENLHKKTKLSPDRIRNIIKCNAFKSNEDGKNEIHGLWALPSLINHQCISNCTRFNIGDTMFVYSLTNLKEGQELFLSYVPPQSPYEKRSESLSGLGITNCGCRLCNYDRLDSTKDREERARLIAYFDEHIMIPITKDMNSEASLIKFTPIIEKHIDSIKKTYSPDHQIKFELFKAYLAMTKIQSSVQQSLQMLLNLLKLTGHEFEFNFSKTNTPNTPMNFKMKPTREPFDVSEMYIYLQVCTQAFLNGYEALGRQALALSRVTAFLILGMTSQDFNEYHSKAIHPFGALLSFKDTITFV